MKKVYLVLDNKRGDYDGYAYTLPSQKPAVKALVAQGFRITTKAEYQKAVKYCRDHSRPGSDSGVPGISCSISIPDEKEE